MNVDYYSHDSGMRNDRKIKAMRLRYGNEGYAVWCMMLEILSEASMLQIDLTPLELELISGDFCIEKNRLLEIIEYMISIGLLQKEENLLHCKNLNERMMPVFHKRGDDELRLKVKKKEEEPPRKYNDVGFRLQEPPQKYNDEEFRLKVKKEEETASSFFLEVVNISYMAKYNEPYHTANIHEEMNMCVEMLKKFGFADLKKRYEKFLASTEDNLVKSHHTFPQFNRRVARYGDSGKSGVQNEGVWSRDVTQEQPTN